MKPGILLTTLCLALVIGFGSQAQASSKAGSKQLLEELRQLARESREKRAADRWLQRALDDLVSRYDRPWQRTILFDDFSDGDYTRNPKWESLEGRFEVVRGQGLIALGTDRQDRYPEDRTQAPAESGQQPDLAGALVGALLNQAFGPKQNSPQQQTQRQDDHTRRDISNRLRLKANVTNAFALTATLRTSEQPASQFEFALLQSQKARYGYRLRIDTGSRGGIELERIRNGLGSIVERRPLDLPLGDGRLHDLAWRQAPDGTVTVLIDDKQVFSVRDRAFRDGYPWLEFRHHGGELTLRALRIEGT